MLVCGESALCSVSCESPASQPVALSPASQPVALSPASQPVVLSPASQPVVLSSERVSLFHIGVSLFLVNSC